MANRKDRRAAAKAKPAYLRRSEAEICKSIVKNGITPRELEENYARGYTAGYHNAGEQIVKGCYAAVCLALNEMHGFGQKRCHDVLSKMDEIMLYHLTSVEAIENVYKKIGLKLDFKDPIDRIIEA
jgi:hypothetical protein